MQLLGPPAQTTLIDIPAGSSGTRATLRAMRDLIRQYRNDATVRALAHDITRNSPTAGYVGDVRALFAFARDSIAYEDDPFDIQRLHAPDATLYRRAGNCADKSILLAALLESLDHPARLMATGYTYPGVCDHVFVQTLIGQNWTSLDASVDGAVPGWQPPDSMAVMIESI